MKQNHEPHVEVAADSIVLSCLYSRLCVKAVVVRAYAAEEGDAVV